MCLCRVCALCLYWYSVCALCPCSVSMWCLCMYLVCAVCLCRVCALCSYTVFVTPVCVLLICHMFVHCVCDVCLLHVFAACVCGMCWCLVCVPVRCSNAQTLSILPTPLYVRTSDAPNVHVIHSYCITPKQLPSYVAFTHVHVLFTWNQLLFVHICIYIYITFV